MKRLLEIITKNSWCVVTLSAVCGAGLTLALFLYADRCDPQQYPHINPMLACDPRHVIQKKEYTELSNRISHYIQEKERVGAVYEAGVFFRDLAFGPTFGVNERSDFAPASLLKLPVAMTLFSLAETSPDILSKKIYVSTNLPEEPTQFYPPKKRVSKNTNYTIEELTYYMLSYSDNTAFQMLYKFLVGAKDGDRELNDAMHDLGIYDSEPSQSGTQVTVKGYGSLFRILYNGSYLSTENSEELLSMLSEADFNDGLRKGVPPNIVVASKFGERYIDEKTKQLHDCGIVYYPDNPYLLCIMTRGNSFDDLSKIIGTISDMVYREVDSRRL